MYPLAQQFHETVSPDAVQVATEFFNQQYPEPIEIQQVAQHAGLSARQLNRRFRATYQLSPAQYLQRVRVHHASQALLATETQIGILALDHGFYEQTLLTRLYRRWMGLAPMEIRNGSRQQA